ncbi:MAG: hypothetical protein AB1Z81_06820, partial [Desulfotignum sp.]
MTGETKQDDPIIELTDVVEDGEDTEQTFSDEIFSYDEMQDENLDELTDVDDFNEIEDIEKAVAADEISVPDEISVSDE